MRILSPQESLRGVLLVMGSIKLFIGGKTRMNFKTAPPSKFDLCWD
jgi:hypothetical protein